MMDHGEEPYRVALQQGRFLVEDISGATILTCTDKDSAAHYVVLLRASYRAGFKAGYRAASQDAGNP
jgi:hypothetical protein